MSLLITATQVKTIAGAGARTDLVAAVVNGWSDAVRKAGLKNKNRAAHFLAEIMTETGGLRILEESGAYRYETILKIFGAAEYSRPLGGSGHSAGIVPAEAKRIAALPVSQRGPVLFNRVYGVGNPKKMKEFNNTGSNDGWLYRGGGMMQATGKSNYAVMAKKTGLPLVEHPELLHVPGSAFTAAYLEWAQDSRCNAAADRDDVVAVRKIINGGTNGLAECRKYLAKAKSVLADYGAPAPVAIFSEPADDDQSQPEATTDVVNQADPDPVPSPVGPPVITIDPEVKGDPELYSVQKRLKAMHYSPGVLDGKWGGGTSGAISAFINDRGGHITVPASLDAFNDVREEIKAELQRAESENFVRPVTEARKTADAATVATVAPEVVPAKRNFLAAIWAAVLAAFGSIWDTISGWLMEAWNFFTDHKDDLPEDGGGFLSTAWEYVKHIPAPVWWLAAAGLFVFLALNARSSVKKITESVQTGARQ